MIQVNYFPSGVACLIFLAEKLKQKASEIKSGIDGAEALVRGNYQLCYLQFANR